MTDEPRIWKSAESLTALARDWDRRFAGRKVDRLGGGPGWLRLSLVNEREDSGPPAQLFLIARPGAVLCWDDDRSPPPPVLDALERVRQKQLTPTPYLLGATLKRVGRLPDDNVLCLKLRTPAGETLQLLHQLFASRGNLVLSEETGRRLWAAHATPHQLLLKPVTAFAPVPADVDSAAASAEARTRGPALLIARLVSEQRARAERDLGRRIATVDRLCKRLTADLEDADRGDRYRLWGETLAIHLHTLERGASEAVLNDVEGREARIPLDPAKAPHLNMEHYFKKARKAERGRETIHARLADTASLQEALERARGDLSAIDGEDVAALEALTDWRLRHVASLAVRERVQGTAPQDIARPFRRHLVDDRWEVWVGRSSAENDELTHKAASPQDWWFHAQGVPGSHVILRTGGRPERVPKTVLARVASVAAWYSKARNSGLVPVLYTLRKYVRKPRKTPPGTALPERAKSLMVEPGLPPETRPKDVE